MAKNGGKRAGAGRPNGAKNKRTKKREQDAARAAAAIEAVIPEAFAGDAHAYLMTIYKDPTKDDAVRMDAAKAAIRYELPTFSPVEQRSSKPGDCFDTVRTPASARLSRRGGCQKTQGG